MRWSLRSGEVGGWFGATTGRASTLVAVVSWACPGLLLRGRALVALVFVLAFLRRLIGAVPSPGLDSGFPWSCSG